MVKKGATSFDKGYFWDLEVASDGYRLGKVWPLVEDIFLIEFSTRNMNPENNQAWILTHNMR